MKYKIDSDIYKYNRDVYRDCVLVDLNKNVIDIGKMGERDAIIDPEQLPEGIICCDTHIASAVLMLNKKGYKTLYSCEGHFDEDIDDSGNNNLTTPYIMFETGKEIVNYAKNLIMLPRQFTLRIDAPSLPTVNEEVEGAYGEDRHNRYYESRKKKRISIYSNLVYGFRDDSDFIDPSIVTREMFDKYNSKDVRDITAWVSLLPDLTKGETK